VGAVGTLSVTWRAPEGTHALIQEAHRVGGRPFGAIALFAGQGEGLVRGVRRAAESVREVAADGAASSEWAASSPDREPGGSRSGDGVAEASAAG
jgi:hypothetical protein